MLRTGGTKEVFADPGSEPAARLTGCKNIAPAVKAGAYEVDVPSWGGAPDQRQAGPGRACARSACARTISTRALPPTVLLCSRLTRSRSRLSGFCCSATRDRTAPRPRSGGAYPRTKSRRDAASARHCAGKRFTFDMTTEEPSMIEQLLQTALDAVQDGRPVVLVSVVRATGSTPRAGGCAHAGRAGRPAGRHGGRRAARAPLPWSLPPPAPARPTARPLYWTTGRPAAWAWCAAAQVKCCSPRSCIPRRWPPRWMRCMLMYPAWLCLPLSGAEPLVCSRRRCPHSPR